MKTVMNIEADLRDDPGSEIGFSDEIDGPILQITSNGIELTVKLDEEHLQMIVDRLSDWGWKAT